MGLWTQVECNYQLKKNGKFSVAKYMRELQDDHELSFNVISITRVRGQLLFCFGNDGLKAAETIDKIAKTLRKNTDWLQINAQVPW